MSGSFSEFWVRAHSVVTFYLLAFAISWVGFVPVVAKSWGASFFQNKFWPIALLLDGCGPTIAVVVTLWLMGERGHWQARLRSSIRGHGTPRWYLVAILLPIGLWLAAQAISHLLWPHRVPASSPIPLRHLFPIALMSIVANPWEEIGWRGFAFETLERQRNPLVAAIIVGVLWGLWHIPLFLWKDSPMAGISFLPWFATIVAQAVVIGWLYNRAGHATGVAIVFHIVSNIAAAAIGVHSPASVAIVDIAAAVILIGLNGPQLGERPSKSSGAPPSPTVSSSAKVGSHAATIHPA